MEEDACLWSKIACQDRNQKQAESIIRLRCGCTSAAHRKSGSKMADVAFFMVIKHYWEGLECPCWNLDRAQVSLPSFMTLPLGFIASNKPSSAILLVKKMSGFKLTNSQMTPNSGFLTTWQAYDTEHDTNKMLQVLQVLQDVTGGFARILNSISCYSLHAFQESSNGENASVPEAQTH